VGNVFHNMNTKSDKYTPNREAQSGFRYCWESGLWESDKPAKPQNIIRNFSSKRQVHAARLAFF
jgi:hypothetical protein